MKYLVALFALLFSLALPAQNVRQLSAESQISLMTVAPGPFMYSAFGHSAIRVFDPVNRIDRCYNYGTFDFQQPNFYLKFCQGKLLYYLDVETYRNFEYGNLYDKRAMQEQVLSLTQEEKERLFSLLLDNSLEENKYYKYDFFYDNCATRIRDILNETFYYRLEFDSSGLGQPKTMRQLLHPYLSDKPWLRFGIDLVLGMPADKKASADQFMFLPDYLHDLMGSAKLNGERNLVLREREIPVRGDTETKPGFLDVFTPMWLMILVAVLGVLSMFNTRAARVFDFIFWLLLGIAGLVIAFLWFATDHSATKMNWNIMWALPTHLLYFWRTKKSEWADNYFMATAMLAGLALLLWMVIPQDMPKEAIPIMILIVIKGMWGRYGKREDI
ncbi:MAG: DUF4105 domain-containing protein [Saprospiraceae bacterium]